MFGKANDASTPATRHAQSVFQDGVSLTGELDAKGDVRFDGKLKGKLKVSDRLTIGATGDLEADLEAGEVVIMGQFKGTILATRRLELRKGAKVTADITTANLVIEEGVFFQGRSSMHQERVAAPVPISSRANSEPQPRSNENAEALKGATR